MTTRGTTVKIQGVCRVCGAKIDEMHDTSPHESVDAYLDRWKCASCGSARRLCRLEISTISARDSDEGLFHMVATATVAPQPRGPIASFWGQMPVEVDPPAPENVPHWPISAELDDITWRYGYFIDDSRRAISLAEITLAAPLPAMSQSPTLEGAINASLISYQIAQEKKKPAGLDLGQIFALPCGRHDDSSIFCSVCQDPACGDHVMRLPNCGHMFHKLCINPWLIEHNTCPTCRKNVV